MRYFLVVYNRREGTGIVARRFPATRRAEAMRARFQAEAAHEGDPDTEIVVLGASSEKVLRRTHARYFDTPGELVNQAAQAAAG